MPSMSSVKVRVLRGRRARSDLDRAGSRQPGMRYATTSLERGEEILKSARRRRADEAACREDIEEACTSAFVAETTWASTLRDSGIP